MGRAYSVQDNATPDAIFVTPGFDAESLGRPIRGGGTESTWLCRRRGDRVTFSRAMVIAPGTTTLGVIHFC
jgi:hypothetical protein